MTTRDVKHKYKSRQKSCNSCLQSEFVTSSLDWLQQQWMKTYCNLSALRTHLHRAFSPECHCWAPDIALRHKAPRCDAVPRSRLSVELIPNQIHSSHVSVHVHRTYTKSQKHMTATVSSSIQHPTQHIIGHLWNDLPAKHLIGVKTQFKPNQTSTKWQHKKAQTTAKHK